MSVGVQMGVYVRSCSVWCYDWVWAFSEKPWGLTSSCPNYILPLVVGFLGRLVPVTVWLHLKATLVHGLAFTGTKAPSWQAEKEACVDFRWRKPSRLITWYDAVSWISRLMRRCGQEDMFSISDSNFRPWLFIGFGLAKGEMWLDNKDLSCILFTIHTQWHPPQIPKVYRLRWHFPRNNRGPRETDSSLWWRQSSQSRPSCSACARPYVLALYLKKAPNLPCCCFCATLAGNKQTVAEHGLELLPHACTCAHNTSKHACSRLFVSPHHLTLSSLRADAMCVHLAADTQRELLDFHSWKFYFVHESIAKVWLNSPIKGNNSI